MTRDYFAYGTKVLCSWDEATSLSGVTTVSSRELAVQVADGLQAWEADRTPEQAQAVALLVEHEIAPVRRAIVDHFMQERP